jgi:phosphoglycolate phosphatase
MKSNYDILIFDWDGTLMDSTAWIVDCMQRAIADNGMPERNDASIQGIIGLGLHEAVIELFPEAEASSVNAICNAYRDHYFGADEQCALFEGVEEVLQQLRGLGFWLAVATGKSRRGLDKVLAETGLEDMFPVTRTADETRSKPHPLMLEEIITDFDSQKERCLMIGDSLFDLQMATNAGMDGLGVSWGVQQGEALQALDPVGLIHEILELPAWLEKHAATRVA